MASTACAADVKYIAWFRYHFPAVLLLAPFGSLWLPLAPWGSLWLEAPEARSSPPAGGASNPG